MARSYVYPVFTKRSLTSPQVPTNLPCFFTHRNRSGGRSSLCTPRGGRLQDMSFFWPLDFSFFVSDAFHHITSPTSQSSSSPKKFPRFLGADGFWEPVEKHRFQGNIISACESSLGGVKKPQNSP